ncbi:MAG TPA: hypothetical protein VFM79_01040 [Pelobium sp.]|nr:hypothetical protein [Pelobium sp.]
MEQHKSLTLLKGDFTPDETIDVLFSLINEKIRFHNLHILGIKEGRSGDKTLHEKRLEELLETKKMISNFVTNAESGTKKISIDGIINLKITV